MGKLKLVVAALVLAGCKQATEAGEHREQVPAKAAPPSPPVISPDALPDAPLRVSAAMRSVATFRKDKLDECTDVTFVGPEGTDPSKLQQALDEHMKTHSDRSATPIQQSCRSQFSDRVALASCEASKSVDRDGGAITVIISANYYDVRTANDSDAHMRDCLKIGGKWESAKRDDPAASRERLRQRAGDAVKASEEAQRALNNL
jgi:hypothetical protein